ncbi:MAG TPA: MarR family winged helix-turn-helix transcriptional regulator [Dehalococcoidia bacterium]|nr:MarR family winged helix-turn-helix transcriptional regulator [Dehalococcoidia bacterium]
MRSQDPFVPPFEKRVTLFLAEQGADADSQAVVFNLDHGGADVIATLESLALRPHGLTKAGFTILMAIWITGPRETRELAAALLVTKGAVVGAVQTLERGGFVERRRSDDDRRLVTVHLTETGRELISRVQKDWHRLEAAVTADLTTAEKRAFAALCRKVARRARVMRREQCADRGLPDPAVFLQNTKTAEQKIPQKEALSATAPR